MDPITAGALIAGGSQIIGSGLSAFSSSRAAKKVARMQIAWERQKAQNAHQWEVEDLKKAGLNPILSADSGGATAGSINPPMPDFSSLQQMGEGVGQVIQSALEMKMQNKKNEADIDKILSDINVQSKQGSLIQAQTIKELAQAKLINKQEAETAANAMLKTEQAHFTATQNKQLIMEVKTRIALLQEQLKQAKTKSQREELERKIHKATWWLDMLVDKGTKVMDSGSKAVTALAASADAVIPL